MLEIEILGQKWTIYLVEEEKYIKKWSDADAAHTIPSMSEIYFNDEELSRIVVVHELCHAFFAEMCTGSAGLDADQTEEVFCDMIGKHGDKILRLARKLYKELKNG